MPRLILREVLVVEFDCHLFVYMFVCLVGWLFVRSFAAAGRFEGKEDRRVGVGGEGALTNDPQARRGLCQAKYLRSRETVSGTAAANDQLKDRGAAQKYSHTLLRGDWMLLGCRRSLWVRGGAGGASGGGCGELKCILGISPQRRELLTA
jgi:hypothetical protein